MPCHPVNNYCFGSSEDEKSNNAEEMSALNVDIETSETKIYNRPYEFKKHQAVQYLPKNFTEWKQTQIISHGGKATSIFKGCWSTQENENEPVKFIDFERDVQEFNILDGPNLDSVLDNFSNSMH